MRRIKIKSEKTFNRLLTPAPAPVNYNSITYTVQNSFRSDDLQLWEINTEMCIIFTQVIFNTHYKMLKVYFSTG